MRRPIVRRTVGALLLVLVTASARAETIQIKIEKLTFVPSQVSAHVGDTIEWVNADFVAHTATARDGAWDVMIAPSATASASFSTGSRAGPSESPCRTWSRRRSA
jgi:plastocyanin